MSAPALTVQINGGPPVSGDQLNTYGQTCDTVAQLRGFIGIQGVQVFLRGQSAPNDGYQGNFYWNASGTAADDNGVTTIVPTGSGSGLWSRINDINNTYTYLTPLTGFNITVGNGITSLILNPAGGLSTGAIKMAATPVDGQIFRLSCTQNISTLTLNANSGQTINNAPTSLTAGTGYSFQYSIAQLSWFRLY